MDAKRLLEVDKREQQLKTIGLMSVEAKDEVLDKKDMYHHSKEKLPLTGCQR